MVQMEIHDPRGHFQSKTVEFRAKFAKFRLQERGVKPMDGFLNLVEFGRQRCPMPVGDLPTRPLRNVYNPQSTPGSKSLCPLDATTVLSRSLAELGIYPAIGPLDSKLRMLDHRIVRTSLSKGVQGSHNFRYVSCYAGKDNVQRAASRLPALPPCLQIGHRWPRPDALFEAVLHPRPPLPLAASVSPRACKRQRIDDDDHVGATNTTLAPVRQCSAALSSKRPCSHDFSHPQTPNKLSSLQQPQSHFLDPAPGGLAPLQMATTGPTRRTRMQEALTKPNARRGPAPAVRREVTLAQSDRWLWEIWLLGAIDYSRDRPPP
ncbi:hypothetical protein BJV78DRAFT_1356483 [Lactifluus subvellereus]|nr:hypothetical protein BJV78DRAFT_1356483 [Lactifluus subvellereus]